VNGTNYGDARRTGDTRDEWTRQYEAEDDTVVCTNQCCGHPVWRHYSSVPGLDRVSSCGCTAWAKSTSVIRRGSSGE
jgi:hypothetical protein